MSLFIGHVNSLGGSNEHVFSLFDDVFSRVSNSPTSMKCPTRLVIGGCSNNAENPTFTLEYTLED